MTNPGDASMQNRPRAAMPADVDRLIDTFADEVDAGAVVRRLDNEFLSAKARAAVRLESRQQVLLVHPTLLRAPRPVLRHVLAHEIAHIALRHNTRGGRLRRMAPLVLAVLLFIAAIVLLATQGRSQVTSARQPVLLLVLFLALVSIPAVGWLGVLACSRRREHRADEFAAARLDAPYNDEIFAVVTATEPATVGRWASLLRDHPSPARRRAHIARQARDQTPRA